MILLIDNYDSFTYNVYQSVSRLGEDVKVVRNDKISLFEIEMLNPLGIILSPGPGRPEDAGICIDLIRTFSGRIPMLGICLGHQAIAAAFGGDVVSSGEVVHGKEATIYHARGGLYRHMPVPFKGGRYHSLVIDRDTLPSDLVVDAECGDGTVMGMRHRGHKTFGIQFHPESILTPDGTSLFKAFLEECLGFDRRAAARQRLSPLRLTNVPAKRRGLTLPRD